MSGALMLTFTCSMLLEIKSQFSVSEMKTIRRRLHFSDGVLDEYSTDEESAPSTQIATVSPIDCAHCCIDTASMPWGEWVLHQTCAGGYSALQFVDWAGEKLAWAFGITKPKFNDMIEEYVALKSARLEDINLVGDMDDENTIITEAFNTA
ncbi:unnamed protein product [Protopolystoma xenopodis]|uniref:Uncharacterized protein n=1 Tax=Protopolystoma xenopodis TaxID=117903 RepID=A0A3S5CN87_9PLAT|nr:unnamed protein product [Protopolystoma xenopodis]